MATEGRNWVLDWDGRAPVSVAVYNEVALRSLYQSLDAPLDEREQTAEELRRLDATFDALYDSVLHLSPTEAGAEWRKLSRGVPAYRMLGSGVHPPGSTILMQLITDGHLSLAEAISRASPAAYVSHLSSARFGAPRGALHALASGGPLWPVTAGGLGDDDARAEAQRREARRIDVLHVLLEAGASAKAAGPVSPLVEACANGFVDAAFLDALHRAGAPPLSAAESPARGARNAAMASGTGGHVGSLRWLLSALPAADLRTQLTSSAVWHPLTASSALCALELAIAATPHSVSASHGADAAGGGSQGPPPTTLSEHETWVRECLRYVCTPLAAAEGGSGHGASSAAAQPPASARVAHPLAGGGGGSGGPLRFLTCPFGRAPPAGASGASGASGALANSAWLPCASSPRRTLSVLQALAAAQPRTMRWLLDSGTFAAAPLPAAAPAIVAPPTVAPPTTPGPPSAADGSDGGDSGGGGGGAIALATAATSVAPHYHLLLPAVPAPALLPPAQRWALSVRLLLQVPDGGSSLGDSWLSQLAVLPTNTLLAASAAGVLEAPSLVCALAACWDTYAAARLRRSAALDVAVAVALSAHLAVRLRARTSTATDALEAAGGVGRAETPLHAPAGIAAGDALDAPLALLAWLLLALPAALHSAWRLALAARATGCTAPCMGALPLPAGRMQRYTPMALLQTLPAAATLFTLLALDAAPPLSALATPPSPLGLRALGLTVFLCWLRTLTLACASERATAAFVLLIDAALQLPLALTLAAPCVAGVLGARVAWASAAAGPASPPPATAELLSTYAALGLLVAAALSLALAAASGNLSIRMRAARLRALGWLEATGGATAGTDTRADRQAALTHCTTSASERGAPPPTTPHIQLPGAATSCCDELL